MGSALRGRAVTGRYPRVLATTESFLRSLLQRFLTQITKVAAMANRHKQIVTRSPPAEALKSKMTKQSDLSSQVNSRHSKASGHILKRSPPAEALKSKMTKQSDLRSQVNLSPSKASGHILGRSPPSEDLKSKITKPSDLSPRTQLNKMTGTSNKPSSMRKKCDESLDDIKKPAGHSVLVPSNDLTSPRITNLRYIQVDSTEKKGLENSEDMLMTLNKLQLYNDIIESGIFEVEQNFPAEDKTPDHTTREMKDFLSSVADLKKDIVIPGVEFRMEGDNEDIIEGDHQVSKSDGFMHIYSLVCDQLETKPLNKVNVSVDGRSLRLQGDHLKVEDWWPLLITLAYDRSLEQFSVKCFHSVTKYLEEVVSEASAQLVKETPTLFTKFMMSRFVTVVSIMCSNSKSLSCIRFERIPITDEHVKFLAKGLSESVTLQYLHIVSCPIRDGCCYITEALEDQKKIELLELSDCEITNKEILSIVKLLKSQAQRAAEVEWARSLRSTMRREKTIAGLKRLTLNHNPGIGDEGVALLQECLLDNYWLKAIDLQNCGIRDQGCHSAIVLVLINRNLEVFDIQNNSTVNDQSLIQLVCESLLSRHPPEKSKFQLLPVTKCPSLSSNATLWPVNKVDSSESVKKEQENPEKKQMTQNMVCVTNSQNLIMNEDRICEKTAVSSQICTHEMSTTLYRGNLSSC